MSVIQFSNGFAYPSEVIEGVIPTFAAIRASTLDVELQPDQPAPRIELRHRLTVSVTWNVAVGEQNIEVETRQINVDTAEALHESAEFTALDNGDRGDIVKHINRLIKYHHQIADLNSKAANGGAAVGGPIEIPGTIALPVTSDEPEATVESVLAQVETRTKTLRAALAEMRVTGRFRVSEPEEADEEAEQVEPAPKGRRARPARSKERAVPVSAFVGLPAFSAVLAANNIAPLSDEDIGALLSLPVLSTVG